MALADMIQIFGRQAFVMTMPDEAGDTPGQGDLVLKAESDQPLFCVLTQNKWVIGSCFFASQTTLDSFPSSNGQDYKARAVFLSHLADGQQNLLALLDAAFLKGESFGTILV